MLIICVNEQHSRSFIINRDRYYWQTIKSAGEIELCLNCVCDIFIPEVFDYTECLSKAQRPRSGRCTGRSSERKGEVYLAEYSVSVRWRTGRGSTQKQHYRDSRKRYYSSTNLPCVHACIEDRNARRRRRQEINFKWFRSKHALFIRVERGLVLIW